MNGSLAEGSVIYSLRFHFCKHALTVALLIAIFLSVAKTGQAQIINWTNTTGTPNPWYHADSNWVGGIAPNSTETARFNQSATYEVWWDNTTASTIPDVGFLNLLAGDVTFLNNGGGLQHEFTILGTGASGNFSDVSILGNNTTLTNRGLYLRSLGGAQIIGGGTLTLDGSHAQGAKLSVDGLVGFQVEGNLNIEAGGLASNTLGFVGLSPGSTGVATVTGSGSQWNNSNGLFLGGNDLTDGGTGALNIVNSAQVNVGNDLNTFSGAALTVSDTGANGNLWVRNSSTITILGSGLIGLSSGSTGMITVTGSGSQWNSSGLAVGRDGYGSLNVEAGGVVRNSVGSLGLSTGSTGVAKVTGIGSQWKNTDLYVGRSGNGTLSIEAGGVVSNTSWGFIGRYSGSTGEATVTGSGSQWINSSFLDVGVAGNGTLNIEAGGLVRNTSFGSIGRFTGATGMATVTGNGSQWINSSSFSVGSAGHGTLNVEAGGFVRSTFGGIGRFSGSTGVATVTGYGSQWNSTIELIVGDDGDGTLNVEAGGLVETPFGYIGANFGSTGEATVTGIGSRWNNMRGLYLGGTITSDGGMGTLYLADSGQVNVGNDLNTLPVAALTVSDTGADGNLWVRNGSIISNSGNGFIGYSFGSMGAATVTGSNSQWNNTDDLAVGFYGDGTLNVEAGGLVSNTEGYIGRFPGSTGVATVTGSGSQWNISSDLYVGDYGNGTLNVEAGGVVNNSDARIGAKSFSTSTGKATVTGSDSQWINSRNLSVGYFSDGTLNVEAGGFVSSGAGQIGHDPNSTGVATVAGVGSQWSVSNQLHVGLSGNGTLNIEAGGVVNSDLSYIGSNSDSIGVATVTGIGSQWNDSSILAVGSGGNGMLSIKARGLVNTMFGSIGRYSGSTGVVTVTGVDSQWNNSSSFEVGSSGNGTLNVEAGGLVSNTRGSIGLVSGSVGIVTVTGIGSRWSNSDNLYLGGRISAPGGSGDLTIQDSGLVSVTNTLKIWGPGTLNLDGGTVQAGTLDPTLGAFNWTDGRLSVDNYLDNLTQDAGTLVMGGSTGTTTIAGDYALSSGGILEIELTSSGGVAGVDFDLLDITGDAMLGGTLDILFQNGFTPSAGDRFEILTAASVLGTFDMLNLPALPGELLWFVNYGATSVELVSTYGADFDEDGDIDDLDLAAWESGFGSSAIAHANGDANGDAFADGFDFLTWQRQLTSGVIPPFSSSTSVPEPTSVLLLIAAAVTMSLQYRNRLS